MDGASFMSLVQSFNIKTKNSERLNTTLIMTFNRVLHRLFYSGAAQRYFFSMHTIINV